MNLLDWANSEVERVTINNPEDDVKNGRVAPMTETFDDLRKMLQEG